jgi:hypothetical protein
MRKNAIRRRAGEPGRRGTSNVDVVLVLLPFFSNLPRMIHNLHSFFHSVAIWRLTKRSAFASTW